MQRAKAHFKKVDPILHAVIEKIEWEDVLAVDNLFEALCDIIVGQQLSGRAADTIFARFKILFGKKPVNAKELLKLKEQQIRSAGMSASKTRALYALAQTVVDGTLQLEKLKDMENEQIVAELIRVKGIGPWSAEMFLMFTLGREDVFSAGDLGLKKAVMKLYKLKKEPDTKKLLAISKKWSPYRTYASRILWKSLEIK